jgi:hypothetical protein
MYTATKGATNPGHCWSSVAIPSVGGKIASLLLRRDLAGSKTT